MLLRSNKYQKILGVSYSNIQLKSKIELFDSELTHEITVQVFIECLLLPSPRDISCKLNST